MKEHIEYLLDIGCEVSYKRLNVCNLSRREGMKTWQVNLPNEKESKIFQKQEDAVNLFINHYRKIKQ